MSNESNSSEDKFREIVEHDLNDVNSIQSIAQMLVELKAQMAELKPIIDQAAEQKEAINEQEREVKKQLQELAEQKHAIDNAVWESRKKMREVERSIQTTNDQLTQAIENQKAKKELEELSKELDELTAGLPWREWAFPHQISGAKQLAVQKRAILADTMGLGKSLTSIIYMDMVKAKKILMVVPNDTTQNMVREIKHWAPHRNVVDASGMPKATRDFLLTTLPGMDNFVLIVNYEINRRDRDFVDHVMKLQLDTVIADESHNVKNNKTSAFKMVKDILTRPNCCSTCGSANVYDGLG